MHDQADELRQLVRQRGLRRVSEGPGAPLVVVGGGKASVGTTTIAVNLAVALARQGRRAVFVDGDLDHGGNASFGLPPHEGSILDVLGGRRSVHEVLQRGPSGIQVVAGHWASRQLRDFAVPAQQRLIAELKNLSPHADVVVIDAGSSRTLMAQLFWQAAECVILVTMEDSLSIMDSYAAIKAMLGIESKVSLHVLVNQAPSGGEAAEGQARIAEACRRFLSLHAEAAGNVVRHDPAAAVDGVLIFPPRSESARAMDRAADSMWTQLQHFSPGIAVPHVSARQDASG